MKVMMMMMLISFHFILKFEIGSTTICIPFIVRDIFIVRVDLFLWFVSPDRFEANTKC